MNKKISVLPALLFASAAASAQSSVTLYGDVDEYIGYIHSSGGRAITGLNDGAILRSRLGV
ncbi:MAG: gram-negative porin family protein, partial [Burkholderia sp.]|nr:gram-negative porin family protein [Burkholderia sp.]